MNKGRADDLLRLIRELPPKEREYVAAELIKDVGEIVARAMTGHATSAMTEHYSHGSPDEKAKAVNAMLGLRVGVRPELSSAPTAADA